MKNLIVSTLFPRVQAQSLSVSIVYALFRFYCGISMAIGAGLAKVFHKIDQAGGMTWSNIQFGAPEWFVKQVTEIGFTFISPSFWAYLAIYGEFIGGLLIAFGLFTRLSAIQMAFQFFVVAFVWYENPMPFVMYYQQLIFWAFALILVMGSGRFSLDYWLQNRASRSAAAASGGLRASAVVACLLLRFMEVSAQNATNQVPFVVKNGGLRAISIEMKHYDYQTRKITGYGLDLGATATEAVNLPVGTRIYAVNKDRRTLLTIITALDAGKTIDVATTFEPSREQWLAASYDEMNEKSASRTAPNPTVETLAAQYQVPLIPLKFEGKGLAAKLVHVRVELPFEGASNTVGFSEHLSRTKGKYVAWPIGTKVYLCDGPFWETLGTTSERLLFIVDAEKSNYTFTL